MDIGKKMRDYRTAKKMTRYRLTQITGVSGHHIKGIEEGTRQPTIDTLQKLLAPLGVSMAEFFSDGGNVAYLSEKEQQLIEHFRSLDIDQAEALLQLSKVMKK